MARIAGINIPNHQQAQGLVKNQPPTFFIDDTNTTTGFNTAFLSLKHPLRDLVIEFNGMVQNPFEA